MSALKNILDDVDEVDLTHSDDRCNLFATYLFHGHDYAEATGIGIIHSASR